MALAETALGHWVDAETHLARGLASADAWVAQGVRESAVGAVAGVRVRAVLGAARTLNGCLSMCPMEARRAHGAGDFRGGWSRAR